MFPIGDHIQIYRDPAFTADFIYTRIRDKFKSTSMWVYAYYVSLEPPYRSYKSHQEFLIYSDLLQRDNQNFDQCIYVVIEGETIHFRTKGKMVNSVPIIAALKKEFLICTTAAAWDARVGPVSTSTTKAEW